jgi:hypothetical protein
MTDYEDVVNTMKAICDHRRAEAVRRQLEFPADDN